MFGFFLVYIVLGVFDGRNQLWDGYYGNHTWYGVWLVHDLLFKFRMWWILLMCWI